MSDHAHRPPSRGTVPRSAASGTLLAALAAVSFGATVPIVARAGHGIGAFSTAALLYAGACAAALGCARVGSGSGAPVRREHVPRLVAVGLFGACVAPSLFAWGLQRVGPTTGSLLLNLEAVFTVLLARAMYRETIGKRVAVAVTAMVLGGSALAIDASTGLAWSAVGTAAVAAATLAWALDNTLTRPLAALNPLQVVAAKAGVGSALTVGIAVAAGEALPTARPALVLLACGCTGYGISLWLYLLAQRRVGAARTGSVFTSAPFVGALLAWSIGDRVASPWLLVAAVLFLIGVSLHATERHRHRHSHGTFEHEHEHEHTHDGDHEHPH